MIKAIYKKREENMKHFFCFSLFIVNIFLCSISSQEFPYKALIIVPTADLVTEPLYLRYADVEKAYSFLPICWGPSSADKSICPRQHQALFNEHVNVVAIHGEEVCIEISNAFYQIKDTAEPQTTYWTLKKYTCPIDRLPEAIHHYLPPAIDYHNKNMQEANSNIITLTWPLYDATTKLRYSAGTRFVYDGMTDDGYFTYIYNHLLHTLHKIEIPKRYACMGTPIEPQICISHFVKLLQDWTRSSGFIPLVWGGISFAKRMTMEGFTLNYAHDEQSNKQAYWQLHEDIGPDSVHTGFDASGLVLRAAQICGIPYFFKNTPTAEQHIRHIAPDESLEEGDILYIPGGLLVVSDIAQNKMIGTFGYQFGFGKVIERSISDIFEDIDSYSELMKAYNIKCPLKLKNKQGKTITLVTTYAFLKLASLWQQ